ncbi:PTS sugar transporter subunit IIB [Oceanobacillus oncorhynchi subsp. incaldanensis]|uniref:Lichenan-specific phosphotransferase enzyme IIB component n=2 Tax=Oceanobacillus TaxID=182709 RepID=A0A0A1MSR5_9BACI|nr:PTS sugar transporter subunit IIB [Oceanobacillus oncorhynchi]MDM8100036.1 PTS sugar transporter subunit IIB [Oceanobacillus oncorhynchi]UUI40583.1 PTS sugar transporter subunit IIB [Oceanobacillus oncorhynchi]GIO18447.1 PTS sugar transporter subunit IIB [Oceanobacillus oncorhynchi subsp. incaldanensis]CEI82021.1 Lichenan-specific phosphotransferase enzyme IIB component [Oceanobacillus oncorhynchi]
MKIRLVCSAGMSTSMLVKKMKEAAEAQNVAADIEAVAESQLKNHLDQLDVVLIGPQVRYLEGKIKEKVEPQGVKVAVIDQMAYGMMQGDKVLKQAIELNGEN